MKTVAKVIDLCKVYGIGDLRVEALKSVNMEIYEGEFIGIVGASGSGKSTLLNILGGLDQPTSGQVIINGEEFQGWKSDDITKFRRKHIGFIFQDFNLVPVLTVYENIVLPIQLSGEVEDKELIDKVIDWLGLREKIEQLPGNLSGGQRQRVAIARALVTKPDIILADEPTGNLDSETTRQVIELLKESANQFCQTVIMITHDTSLIRHCHRVFTMKDGVLTG